MVDKVYPTATRFDLETKLSECNGVVEDLELLFRRICDSDDTPDQLANMALGLSQVYAARFEELVDVQCALIKQGDLK